ncbi:PREDICTED: LOW QUALITY PROTEIN: P2Y purinoceptor 13 [Mesitornis unicolor]|uniref:LOW QUALITY PROTEIN: P2Y purinoceptor 13 n=1 Tax=Mesitornis unicolor TaxID=54374 RepID=UPI0005293DA2|nr:PREDICTED: LOW QUALITY PROTEIN: P2Y purinoceptor 13 [Mesitornis unicolor]
MADFAVESTSSNASEEHVCVPCEWENSTTHLVVFPVLYTLVFLLRLVLNSMACWVFCSIPSTKPFIIYLKNISVSDFIMTLMVPLKVLVDSDLAPWQLKAFVCRFAAVVFYNTMYITIVLLGLIAFDRFLRIVLPFRKFWVQELTSAKVLAALVWFFFFALSVPNMALTNKKATPQSMKKCAALKSPFGLKWHKAINYVCQFIFWTILILMFLFYTIIAKKVYDSYRKTQKKDTQLKKRIKGKVFIIFTVFFLCFTPYHAGRVPYTLSQTSTRMSCHLQRQLLVAKEIMMWMVTLNICFNPLIYKFLCKLFRDRVLCKRPEFLQKSARTSLTAATNTSVTDT